MFLNEPVYTKKSLRNLSAFYCSFIIFYINFYSFWCSRLFRLNNFLDTFRINQIIMIIPCLQYPPESFSFSARHYRMIIIDGCVSLSDLHTCRVL